MRNRVYIAAFLLPAGRIIHVQRVFRLGRPASYIARGLVIGAMNLTGMERPRGLTCLSVRPGLAP